MVFDVLAQNVGSVKMTTATHTSKPNPASRPRSWLRMYRRMLMIRLFEEQVNDLYTRALMPGLAHLYMGKKRWPWASAKRCGRTITSPARIAGTGTAWRKARRRTACSPSCWARKRATAKARAARCTLPIRPRATWAPTRSSRGARGSPRARRLSAKRLGTGQVAVCFFGEGALGQGVLYEVMNMAALWKLPVIYVCENNMYNEYTHFSETTAGDILARAAAFGLPAESVDGQDVRAVYAAATASWWIGRARGRGPSFLL